MPKKRDQGGVWNIDRPGRPMPFGLQWREVVSDPAHGGSAGAGSGRKVRTEFFDTLEKRDARAAALRKDMKRGSLLTMTRVEADEWRAFKANIGQARWQDVVAAWRTYQTQNGLSESTVSVQQAVDADLKRAAALAATIPPQMSKDTYRQKKHKLSLFAEHFGQMRITTLTGQQIESWIESCENVESPATFNAYLKIVRAMLEPYVAKGDLRRNPAATVKKKDDSISDVSILTVDATAHLFAFALESDRFKVCVGRLALEAFAGLRFASACRIAKADIIFEDRGIVLPAAKLKTKKRHHIDNLPGHLWQWLKVTPAECWALTPRQYMELKTDLFTEAGVMHPRNCLRHNFATYHVAALKNPGLTAYILCHRSQELLYEHYKGRATEAAGKKYHTLTPRTAAKLAATFSPQPARELPAA